jgi:hypothetical protein
MDGETGKTIYRESVKAPTITISLEPKLLVTICNEMLDEIFSLSFFHLSV